MSEWKDTTSYQMGDKEKEVRSVTLSTQSLRIVVHKHIHYGNAWLISCRELNIENKELGVDSLEDAKAKALVVINQKIRGYMEEIDAFLS